MSSATCRDCRLVYYIVVDFGRTYAFGRLRYSSPSQPVALGSVDGIHPDIGRARPIATCFSPSVRATEGHCTASYEMVWYGMVRYGTVRYGMVWYGMVWYGVVCCGVV